MLHRLKRSHGHVELNSLPHISCGQLQRPLGHTNLEQAERGQRALVDPLEDFAAIFGVAQEIGGSNGHIGQLEREERFTGGGAAFRSVQTRCRGIDQKDSHTLSTLGRDDDPLGKVGRWHLVLDAGELVAIAVFDRPGGRL